MGINPSHLCSKGNGQRVITTTVGADPPPGPGLIFIIQADDCVHRPADFEGTTSLLVFALEEQLTSRQLVQFI